MIIKTKEDKAILEAYTLLYKNSTPKASFKKLVKEAKVNEFGQKEIDFMAYSIDINKYEEIIKQVITKYKFKGPKERMFRNTIALGCSPTFKIND